MDIEQIIQKKKKERTEEEQAMFIKYKKKQHNEKQKIKKLETNSVELEPFIINEIDTEEPEQEPEIKPEPEPEPEQEQEQEPEQEIKPEPEPEPDLISKDDVDEYIKYCLEFEKEKLKNEIKQEVPTSSEPSFLEQIARSAIMQMTNILVPLGLALTLNYLPAGIPSSAAGSVAHTSTSNPLPVKPDMFAGQLFQ